MFKRLLKNITVEDAKKETLKPAVVIKSHPICFHLNIIISLYNIKNLNKYTSAKK